MPNIAPKDADREACLAVDQAHSGIRVAVAVIQNESGAVLISRRPDHTHQGGLWEFPGGKVETDERVEQALAREVHEELGIDVRAARPLIRIHYDYPDKKVLLDVWRITAYSGSPVGRENQRIEWVAATALRGRAFPAANYSIITAVQLPSCLLITPEPDTSCEFLEQLELAFMQGIRFVLLRARRLRGMQLLKLATDVCKLAERYGARVLLNADAGVVQRSGAHGIHLSSIKLRETEQRPLGYRHLVSASCHTPTEIDKANRIGVDFALASPVLPTQSHPAVTPIGWAGFTTLAECARMPLFALGGMQPDMLERAWSHGAQGIAAIRGLWPAGAV
jgi:8-oxo-dGTP diphosphatase